ncbi:aggregation-promoting factor [Pseudolactococcus reticulitermitis]|nr:LysM domain-containing protein [Lactococcus reticulitermitis]
MKTYNRNTNNTTAKLSLKTMALLAGLLFTGSLLVANQTANADQVTYTVQSGDTLSSISDDFFHDQAHIQTIATNNHIDNISLIYVGQELKFDTSTKTDGKTPTKPNAAPSSPAVAPITNATQSTASIATNNGFTATSAKEAIAMTESGGSYTAQNGQYYGRYQLTASYLGGDFSPENQERVADAYVADRYGSWEAAWQFHLANGWY